MTEPAGLATIYRFGAHVAISMPPDERGRGVTKYLTPQEATYLIEAVAKVMGDIHDHDFSQSTCGSTTIPIAALNAAHAATIEEGGGTSGETYG